MDRTGLGSSRSQRALAAAAGAAGAAGAGHMPGALDVVGCAMWQTALSSADAIKAICMYMYICQIRAADRPAMPRL
ncbi:hypothetical protein SeMB42_g03875 [Synchytrium endobioticum]|uniref:Uncharacterized protein n=1 Tax=Synchytrium endobioticum TaxID=286115 RepID=A0A507D3K3_9FUNG|nr:hypothetical protein SeMB42_g03875 [Synchytrium endobioticum]